MLYSGDLSTEDGSQTSITYIDWQNVTFGNQTNINSSILYTCDFEDNSQDGLSSHIFKTCVYLMYSAVFMVALGGNGLVCYVVHTTPHLKTVTNYFIVNLAVGDIFMTVLCVPFSFVPVLILRYWPFGAMMCKAVNYAQAVSVLVSAYTLLAISIDRYNMIMHPLKPRLGTVAAKLVVLAVWCGAMSTAAPIAIMSKLQSPSLWHQTCKVDICAEQWSSPEHSRQYTYALLLLQFALPLTALVYTYVRIACVVWGRPPGEAVDARDRIMRLAKWKMIKMMVTVVAVLTICWLPLNIFIVLWSIHEEDVEWTSWPGLPYVWFASHWLAMSHSCYNPIIYCYMNAKYRRGFKQVLKKILCVKLKGSNRSFPRSSVCDGVPLSEMVGANVTAYPRRIASGCKGRTSCLCHSGLSSGGSRCTACIALHHVKLGPTSDVNPPSKAGLLITSDRPRGVNPPSFAGLPRETGIYTIVNEQKTKWYHKQKNDKCSG